MAFSDQALSKFLQAHPRLTNNMMSFSDLSEQLPEEDGNTAFGVFILKSGEEFFFIPALSRNDVMYPIDMVYFNTDQKFFPLTEMVKNLISSMMPSRMGLSTKTPTTINKNPSVEDLIRPPRTGKFAYASSRLEEVLATSPQYIRDGLKSQIEKEAAFAEPLNRMFGLRNIYESLSATSPDGKLADEQGDEYVPMPQVKVVTDGKGLSDQAIQDILEYGYAIMGQPAHPRTVAMSYQRERGPDKYQKVTLSTEGTAHEILLSDGTTCLAAIPEVFSDDCLPKQLLFEDGSHRNLGSSHEGIAAITKGEPRNIEEVYDVLFDRFPPIRLGNVYPVLGQDEPLAIFHDQKLVGVTSLRHRRDNNGVTTFETNGPRVSKVVMVKGLTSTPRPVDGVMYLSDDTVCLPLAKEGSSRNLETSLRRAEALNEAKLRSEHMTTCSIICDGPEFYMGDKMVGPEHNLARSLAEEESVPRETVQALIKEAKEHGSVRFYMSKPMDKSAEIPSYGAQPAPDNVVYPDERIRDSMVPAMQTNDPSVVESTLVSEILQDPNMFDTIEGYLPDIAQCVDRLGRVLLLTRLHSDMIFGETDATETTALLAAVKNSFKTLGDNYLTLERLVANARISG